MLGADLDNFTAAYRGACRRAGLPKGVNFHSLRHTFGTWIGLRAPELVARDLMAHKPKTVTQSYQHAPWSEKVKAIEGLPRLLAAQRSQAEDESGV